MFVGGIYKKSSRLYAPHMHKKRFLSLKPFTQVFFNKVKKQVNNSDISTNNGSQKVEYTSHRSLFTKRIPKGKFDI